MTRRGFVLLAVLSWMGSTGLVASAFAIKTQRAVRATANRVQDERAEWTSRGCIERALAEASSVIETYDSTSRNRAWNSLAANVARRGLLEDCAVNVSPAGARLPVNVASEELIERFLRAKGYPRSGLAAGIVDWIDADSVALPNGAEASWYGRRNRPAPPNTFVQGPGDLRMVRGLSSSDSSLLTQFDYQASRVALLHADAATLRALPALGPSQIDAILSGDVGRAGATDLAQLERFASPRDAERFRAEFPDLAAVASLETEFWLISMGTLSARLIRVGGTVALVDWRRIP